MKREIKFRAWDKDNSVMIYDGEDNEVKFSLNGTNVEVHTLEEIHYMAGGEDAVRYEWQEMNCEVMQYTGLKDKNGKEIYEGDVLKRTIKVPALGDDVNESIEVVEYGTAGFDVRRVGTDDSSYLKEWTFHSIEVIGNIYDNSELLK